MLQAAQILSRNDKPEGEKVVLRRRLEVYKLKGLHTTVAHRHLHIIDDKLDSLGLFEKQRCQEWVQKLVFVFCQRH